MAMTQVEMDFLRQQSDEAILESTQKLVSEERRLTAQLLHHLKEIDRRMIYAKQGFPSLYEFLVSRLGYSSGAAYRRISAMRLLRDFPEIEKKIEDGSMNLSTASKVHGFFRDAKTITHRNFTPEQKLDILEQVESKTTREVEKILLKIEPEVIPRDRVRQITVELTEIKFIADEVLRRKLDDIRLYISNKYASAGYKEAISEASDIAIQKFETNKVPKIFSARGVRRVSEKTMPSVDKFEFREPNFGAQSTAPLNNKQSSPVDVKNPVDVENLVGSVENSNNQLIQEYQKNYSSQEMPQNCLGQKVPQNKRSPIPANLRRQVWQKNNGRCAFQNCGSRFRLQIDHIIPLAKGGPTKLANLRLLCQTHNLLEAQREFGDNHMSKHVKKFL
jgi:5-methylcytosine-specific restriction endonuclease McrA